MLAHFFPFFLFNTLLLPRRYCHTIQYQATHITLCYLQPLSRYEINSMSDLNFGLVRVLFRRRAHDSVSLSRTYLSYEIPMLRS